MYNLFKRNVYGFLEIVNNEYLLECFKPITLLTDKDEFIIQKMANTNDYKNLIVIMNKANAIKDTKKYHRFGTFLREVEEEGFLVDKDAKDIELDIEIVTNK